MNNQEPLPGMGCVIVFLLLVLAAIFAVMLVEKTKQEAKESSERAAAKINIIEGEVISVEMRIVPDPFDEKDENGKPKKGIQIRFESHEPNRTVVKFADGREKEFLGIPDKPIPKKYVLIHYDGNNRIKTIESKE